MTDPKRFMRPRLAVMAVLGALALGGCAGTHVGDAWQCPMAQGKVCASVAAADPAVTGRADPAALRPAGAVSDCGGGCNPFAWIAELFAAKTGESPMSDANGAVSVSLPAEILGDSDGAALSRSHAAAPPAPAPAGDDLRTPELVGRVWIAPFADADGVYHEAGWVRLVIEPAGWRLR